MKKRHGIITAGLLSFLAVPASADLFFSEYIEGSSNNKVLEIYNSSESSIDLSNYSIQLFSNGNSVANSTAALSGLLAPQDVYVIANPNANTAILDLADETSPTINFNGDDAITLVLNSEVDIIVDVIGQIGTDPGSEWGTGNTSTQNNTIRRKRSVTSGDNNPNDAFDPAIEWEGFAQDTFAGLGSYDDVIVEPPVDIANVSIPDIQGASHQSPLVNQQVTTSGIVTAVDSNLFYLQDPNGDENSNTSDAIIVFTGSTPTVTVGDVITLTATVSEFIPGGASTNNLSTTQLSSATITVESSGNELPKPIIIGQGGRVPPNSIIDNDNFSIFDPTEDGIDFYESLEGMLVSVTDAIAVSPSNRFNETFVLANQGADATGVNARGGITINADDFNPERIQIQLDNTLLPDFSLSANVGDKLGNVTGVVNYNFGNFEVVATQNITLTPGGLTPESTALVGDDSHITIASYNVENLDPMVENIDLVNSTRDIDDDIADGKFSAIAKHLVDQLNAPDIIALQEIQDSDGAQNTGTVDAQATADTLIAAITVAGGPTYEYTEIAPVDLADGGQLDGNIRVAYLYNPARVSLNADSPARIGEGDAAFDNSRKSLYTSFQFNDETVHIINNHFSSKGGSTPLFGQIQPFINGREENRDAQAAIINAFVDNLIATDSEAKVIVLGDINEFYFEQPLLKLKGEEPALVNLSESLETNEIYSYIFQGNSQALDHALVSHSISNDVEFDAVHLNSEFADQASDHDPLVIRLKIEADVPPAEDTPTIMEIREFFWEQVANGAIQGQGRRPWRSFRNLLRFNYQFFRIDYAIRTDRKRRALRLTRRVVKFSDGQRRDWVKGSAVAELNAKLVLLKNSLEN